MDNNILEACRLCPRNCGVNRTVGEKGFCNSDNSIKAALVSLHKWEEPCISGTNGSGTVFFSNCNLKCVFCQNHLISQEGHGESITIERLAQILIEQQSRGAHNINLVTPTQYIPQIIEALKIAKQNGLNIPILYNSNGYENVDAIKILRGYVDVFLPDLKYFDDKYATLYSHAPHYFSVATAAIAEMFNQVGPVKFDNSGLIKKGVIIRHLLLPGLLFDSKKVVDYIHSTYKDDVFISLMNQYTPMHLASNFPKISKKLNPDVYDKFIDYCISIGITNAFIQEGTSASAEFVPNFDLTGVSR